MLPHIDIENLLQVDCTDAGKVNEVVANLTQALQAQGIEAAVSDTRLRFHTEWEPPFKVLKDWTKTHPECTLMLLADAFAKHHWLLKATIHNGKSDELTVSRIDDEFDTIFKEVYGVSFEQWEKAPREPFTV